MSILRIEDTDSAFFIEYARADSFATVWTLTDSAGVAIDITGYTFKFTVNPDPAPLNADDEVFSINGVITDAPNGKVSFSPASIDTTVTPNTYFYDLQITDAGGKVRTAVISKFTITQDITKV